MLKVKKSTHPNEMKPRRNYLRLSGVPKIKIGDSDREILIWPAWEFTQLGLVLTNEQDLAELLCCVWTGVLAARLHGEDETDFA